MYGSLRLLLIVPAYNEAKSIGQLVSQLNGHLPQADILVVNDGSTDDTATQVPRCAKLLNLPFNLGIGGAMQTGYRYAHEHGYDVAVQVDGDGQHRPDQVHLLIAHLQNTGCDLVIGSRFLQPGQYKQTRLRMLGVVFLRQLLKMLTGQTFTDCTSGFRAVNRKVIDAFAQWYPDDYPEPEVILLLQRAGFALQEVAVQMRYRQSGQTSIPVSMGFFYVMKVATALLLNTVRHPWSLRETISDTMSQST